MSVQKRVGECIQACMFKHVGACSSMLKCGSVLGRVGECEHVGVCWGAYSSMWEHVGEHV